MDLHRKHALGICKRLNHIYYPLFYFRFIIFNDLVYQQAYDNRYYALNEGEYIELERIAMNKTMEKVFEDLSNFKSIVIDIRFNGDGQDVVSLELLSWLNDSPKLMDHQSLFYNDQESPTWDITIESKEKHFTGDVYLLTSQQTGSAAEIFALGSMTLPSVRRIGMPTMGALSTALEKELPNIYFPLICPIKSKRTSQSLSKSVSEPTYERKIKTGHNKVYSE